MGLTFFFGVGVENWSTEKGCVWEWAPCKHKCFPWKIQYKNSVFISLICEYKRTLWITPSPCLAKLWQECGMAFTFFNDQLPPRRGEESGESTNLKCRPGDFAACNLQWSDDRSGIGYDRFAYTVLYGHAPPKCLLRVTRSDTAPPMSQGTKKLCSFSTRFLSSVLGDRPLVHDNSWVHSKTTRKQKGLIFKVETKFGNVSTHRLAARVCFPNCSSSWFDCRAMKLWGRFLSSVSF